MSTGPQQVSNGIEVHLVGCTDVGLVREHNEDNLACARLDDNVRDFASLLHHELQPLGTLLVVCDGMGGAAAGEVASSMAVETLPEIMRGQISAPAPPGVVDDADTALARKLRFAAEEANRRIFAEQQVTLARAGMGTTMTAAHLCGDRAIIAQVGDSRCYVLRRGALAQVTRDQSLVNQLLETGQITLEQAKYFEHSNVILQALGVQEEVEVQLSRVLLRRGDRMLLCSDGLVGVISDEEIAAVLGATDDPSDTARMLIELANNAGGPDNITVIVAYLNGSGLAEPNDSDTIEYSPWRIDPAPSLPPPITPHSGAKAADPEESPSAPKWNALQLFSIAIVLGLLTGSILVGMALWKRAVTCDVRSDDAGLIVSSDGRDSGVRTAAGARLRLTPGRHSVAVGRSLGGADAFVNISEVQVDVRSGEACVIQFNSPSNEQ